MNVFWRKNSPLHPFPLQVKIFAACITVAVAVMVISVAVTYIVAARTIENNAYNYIYESMRYTDDNLDALVQDAMAISLSVATNKELVLGNLLKQQPEVTYDAFAAKKEVDNYLAGFLAEKGHIRMVAVVATDGTAYQSGGALLLKSVIQEPWFHAASQTPSVHIFYNTPADKRIFLCRTIRYNQKLIGMAIVELDYEILKKSYAVAPLEKSTIVTLSAEGDVVFTNGDWKDLHSIDGTPLQACIKAYTPERRYYQVQGKKMLVVLYRSAVNQLTTVGMVSYKDLIVDALEVREQMLFVVLFSVVLAALTSWLFSRVVCQNMQQLQHSMLHIQSGDMSVRSTVKSRDEIGAMAHAFNKMMDRIQMLMEEIRSKEEQKREAEQSALQAQIQPHFIYNALNSMKYVAHMRGEYRIEEVSTALVNLLRGVLGNHAALIPLWQECAYIGDYLKIQRFKFNKAFEIAWDVEEGLWEYMIPRLLLQPIVENALLHGIAHKENGRIDIQVMRREDEVLLKVADNGKGMTQGEIAALLRGETQSSAMFRSVGFTNTMERIRLIYGENYGIDVVSFPGAFTSVEIHLPATKEEEET